MFRKDIQGLRAIAVIVVLLFHFWPHRLPGGYVGVDVFFVISGFLITLHLLKKPPVTWKALVDFWARRIRRLVPAATVVLAATVVASLLWLPETMIQRVLHEVVASAVYVQNWALSLSATDYLAATDAPSPVQHYWSLSIEEQYYAVWPVIIGGIFLLGRRFFTSNKLLAAGMVIIFTASLAYSIYLTHTNPAAAYFVTPTRVWELTIGGIIALLSTRFVVPTRVAALMAWGGLAMIASAVLLFTKETSFPGYTALLPTLGTALVIMAATDAIKWSPRRLLGLRPVQFMGDISYSVYLWHWPVLIIAPFVFGIADMPFMLSASLVVNIIVLAYFTKIYVEDPVRRSKRIGGTNRKTYAYGLASIAVVIGLTFAVQAHPKVQAVQRVDQLKMALETDPCVGAGVLRDKECFGKYDGVLLAPASFAKTDKSKLYEDNCWSVPPQYLQGVVCSYGNLNAEKKVALLGNSHAGMWIAAIDAIATENNWRLDTYLSSSCYTIDQLQDLTKNGADAPRNCQEWNRWAVSEIVAGGYDTVVMSNASTSGLVDVEEGDMETVKIAGYTDTIDQLVRSGKKVFVLRDSPRPLGDRDIPDCLAIQRSRDSECIGNRDNVLRPDPLYMAAQEYGSSRVHTLDLTDRFCDKSHCYSAVGGVVIYFDSNHVSNSYAATLTPDIRLPLVSFVNGMIEE